MRKISMTRFFVKENGVENVTRVLRIFVFRDTCHC